MNHDDLESTRLPALGGEHRLDPPDRQPRLGGTAALVHALEALQDEDANIRLRAAEALSGLGGAEVIDRLLQAFEDASEHVGMRAARTLGTITGRLTDADKQQEIVTRLVDMLRDEDLSQSFRLKIAVALWLIGGAAVPALIQLFEHESYKERARTIIAGIDRQAVPVLLAHAAHPNSQVRASIAETLETIRDPRAVPSLITMLKDDEPQVRRSALTALHMIRRMYPFINADLLPHLVAALEDPHHRIRQLAVEMLHAIGSPLAAPALRRTLKDPDINVQVAAVGAFTAIQDPEAVPILLEKLKDERSYVDQNDMMRICDRAAMALTFSGSGEAQQTVQAWQQAQIEKTLAMLQDDDDLARWRASELFDYMLMSWLTYAPPLVAALIEMIERERSVPKPWIIRLLEDVGDAQAVPTLLRVFEEGDLMARRASIEALGAIMTRDKSLIPDLLDLFLGLLDDTDGEVQRRTIHWLSEADHPRAAQTLTDRLAGSPPFLPETIAALGEIGQPETIDALLPLTAHRLSTVREVTLHAFGELGRRLPSARPQVWQALHEHIKLGEAELQKTLNTGAALRALGRLGLPEGSRTLLSALRHADPVLRGSAAEALGELYPSLNDPEVQAQVIDGLAGLLGDWTVPDHYRYHPDLRVCLIAVQALGKIDAAPARQALTAWQDSLFERKIGTEEAAHG